MKKLTTILLLFLCMTAFCSSDTIGRKEFKLGIIFSPEGLTEISKLRLDGDNGYNLERSYFNYVVGIVGQFPITQKLDIGTGITYSQQDLKGTYYCAYCNSLPFEPERLNLRFLEIPVFIQYNLLNSKIKLHVQAGFIGSYLISRPDLNLYNRQDLNYASNTSFNRPLSKGFLGIGTNIDIGKKINFQLTPTYRYSFNYLFNDTNLKMHSLGITAGMTYRINK